MPINLSTGLNVSGVPFTMTYNPAMLTLGDGVFNTSIPGVSAVFHIVTPGMATLTAGSATQFNSTAGPLTLGCLSAVAPNDAPLHDDRCSGLRHASPSMGAENEPEPANRGA